MSFGSCFMVPQGNLVSHPKASAWHPSTAQPPAATPLVCTAARHPDYQDEPKSGSGPRAPGSLQTQASLPIPSPDTAVTQKKQGHFWLPLPEHRCLEAFCLCPHLPGQSF